MKKKRVSLYDKLEYIYKNNFYEFLYHYIKSNIFHVTVGSLVSIYILELFVIFTKFYLGDPTVISNMIAVVVVPLMVIVIMFLGYGLVCIWLVIKVFYELALEMLDNKKKEKIEDKYRGVTKKYRRKILLVHGLGIFLYSFSTFVIPYYLFSSNSIKLTSYHPVLFSLQIWVIGTALGLIGNMAGYWRNQRIDWVRLFPILQKDKVVVQEVKRKNYKYFLRSLISYCLLDILVCVIGMIVVFSLHDKIKQSIYILITQYSFLILSFITLFIYYNKKVFSLEYAVSNKDYVAFPSLDVILTGKVRELKKK